MVREEKSIELDIDYEDLDVNDCLRVITEIVREAPAVFTNSCFPDSMAGSGAISIRKFHDLYWFDGEQIGSSIGGPYESLYEALKLCEQATLLGDGVVYVHSREMSAQEIASLMNVGEAEVLSLTINRQRWRVDESRRLVRATRRDRVRDQEPPWARLP